MTKLSDFLSTCDALVYASCERSEKLKNECFESLKNYLEENVSSVLEKNLVCHFYGSRVIGLANDSSDLNIYLEIDNNYYAEKDIDRDNEYLKRIKDLLLEDSSHWEYVEYIPTANVPLLTMIYLPLNIKCDITVSNGVAVQNTLIMKHFFELQPKAVSLYHLLKLILTQYERDMNGYLFKLLVIFYLQCNGYLPSVRKVQEGIVEIKVNGFNVEFNAEGSLESYELVEMTSYKEHVENFFHFFTPEIMIPSNVMMSVYEGRILKRSGYEFARHFFSTNNLWICELLNQKSNVGRFIRHKDWKRFVDLAYSFYNKCCIQPYWKLFLNDNL